MGVPACRTGMLYDTYVEGNIRAALPHHCLTYLSDLAVSNCAYARFGKDACFLLIFCSLCGRQSSTMSENFRTLDFCAAWPWHRPFCLQAGRCGCGPGLTLECRQNFVRNSLVTRAGSGPRWQTTEDYCNDIGASLYVMEMLCSLCRAGDSHVSLSASWKWWLIIVNEGASSLCCYTCVS